MTIDVLDYDAQRELADGYGTDIASLPYEMDIFAYHRFHIPVEYDIVDTSQLAEFYLRSYGLMPSSPFDS